MEMEGWRSAPHIRAIPDCPGPVTHGREACATGEPAPAAVPTRLRRAPPHLPPARLEIRFESLSTTRLRTEPYLDHWLLPIPCFNVMAVRRDTLGRVNSRRAAPDQSARAAEAGTPCGRAASPRTLGRPPGSLSAARAPAAPPARRTPPRRRRRSSADGTRSPPRWRRLRRMRTPDEYPRVCRLPSRAFCDSWPPRRPYAPRWHPCPR